MIELSANTVQKRAPSVFVLFTYAQTAPAGNANHARLRENLSVLKAATDAAGRKLEVIEVDLLPYLEGVQAAVAGARSFTCGLRSDQSPCYVPHPRRSAPNRQRPPGRVAPSKRSRLSR
jgi:hypothetical protein